jgi:tRNA (mo5U34)-methyltransferase
MNSLSQSDIEQVRKEVDALKWHHTIDLGHGIVTPGQDNSPKKLKRLEFPESFKGKSVLDIGSWDGFFAFEAERRGADKVLATDSFIWRGGVDWADKSGFNLAKRVLNSKVDEKEVDILDISPENVGMHDVVFFSGCTLSHAAPIAVIGKSGQCDQGYGHFGDCGGHAVASSSGNCFLSYR